MNSTTRIISLLLIIILGIGAYSVVSSEPEQEAEAETVGLPEIPERIDGRAPLALTSSAQCAECHQDIYDEWKSSHHEFAWRNPEPRRKELSNNFRNKDCIPCHAPRPLLEVGFGKRPLERETARDDGVNCFTCHRNQDVMVGANDLSPAAQQAPCNPVTWKALRTVQLCSPCHDQHKVEQDWLRSRYAVKGSPDYKDCNDCHMPVTPGPGTKGSSRTTHRHHGFAGGHDKKILRTAGIVRAIRLTENKSLGEAVKELTGRSWQPKEDLKLTRGVLIEVKNTGTGHNLPSDERHRAVDLYAQFVPKLGPKAPPVRLTRFRNPYRHEFEMINPFKDIPGIPLEGPLTWAENDITLTQVRILPEFNPTRKVFYVESTQLASGESRFLWFDLPDWGEGTLELKLYYKLQPYLSNDDATQISETNVVF